MGMMNLNKQTSAWVFHDCCEASCLVSICVHYPLAKRVTLVKASDRALERMWPVMCKMTLLLLIHLATSYS
jgi:hypothetical protein